jgi:hypothetical protein
MKASNQVGFSQRIRLEWLEYTAQLVLKGRDASEIESSLQDLLGNKLSIGGSAERGNREKAITILKKIWVAPPGPIEFLRDEALDYLSAREVSEHLVLHWCMAMAAYPFWAQVADAVGRLLRLQGRAVAGQVQQRLREQLGERETVARATRRVLRSFVDWEALRDGDAKGSYVPGEQQHVTNKGIVLWILKALLVARRSGPRLLAGATQAAELFPFVLSPVTEQDVDECKDLSVIHRGVDGALVGLTA